ncbi:hypothetical protein D0863_01624 [Hortaea werneckii]|uniref:Chitin-binding type-4 domain-containing protein n=1 Tax=Hortaea werneckii TaxID=91943 RepID=A0A3M7EKD3_HORWE|nr:hypothetical protein D0863_01624 [Hortaea werneckii]
MPTLVQFIHFTRAPVALVLKDKKQIKSYLSNPSTPYTNTNMHFNGALLASVATFSSMAPLANAHGYFTKPEGRQPGTAFQDACGMQAYYNMKGSMNGNIQGLQQVVANQDDYNPDECHLWKCKGMKYADNKDNVQSYTPGQSVDLTFTIVAPHTGHANVSIIDTSSPNGKVIAKNLKKWDTYASTSSPIQDSQQDFSVKMPTNLGDQCAEEGKCAIQMYWDAPDIDQTYESCIDFTLSSSNSKREAEAEDFSRPHPRDFSPRAAAEE